MSTRFAPLFRLLVKPFVKPQLKPLRWLKEHAVPPFLPFHSRNPDRFLNVLRVL